MEIDDPYKETWLRGNLLDFGYKISTNEMPRDFYLENRISKDERDKLIDILKIIHQTIWDKHSSYIGKHRLAYHFNFGLLGIGTSVYPEKYWKGLENFFAEKGYTQEDFVDEKAAAAMWNLQCREHETYQDYLTWCDSFPAFDEKINPISEEEFNLEKEKEEVPYVTKKKVVDILKRKGEDLDFLFCPENPIDRCGYFRSQIDDFRFLLFDVLKDKNYTIKDELDYLDGVDYFVNPETGKILRYKMIISPEKAGSCRVSFSDSRSFHFYFGTTNLNLKIRDEQINNSPFCRIIRSGEVKDLEATIKNGEETGVFENPEFLKFKKI